MTHLMPPSSMPDPSGFTLIWASVSGTCFTHATIFTSSSFPMRMAHLGTDFKSVPIASLLLLGTDLKSVHNSQICPQKPCLFTPSFLHQESGKRKVSLEPVSHQILDDRGIGQRARIAEIADVVGGPLLEDAAHDLAPPGLWEALRP